MTIKREKEMEKKTIAGLIAIVVRVVVVMVFV